MIIKKLSKTLHAVPGEVAHTTPATITHSSGAGEHSNLQPLLFSTAPPTAVEGRNQATLDMMEVPRLGWQQPQQQQRGSSNSRNNKQRQ